MRGDWDNTKSLLERGRDTIIEEVKALAFDVALGFGSV